MVDLLVAEEAQIVSLQDKWLIAWGKATPETKTWRKNAAKAEKKLVEKQNNAQDKAKTKSQNQSLSIRKMALSNGREIKVGSFKNIFSNPLTGDDPPPEKNSISVQESPTT